MTCSKTDVLTLLAEMLEAYPYLRVGQLIGNVCVVVQQDVYYITDDKLKQVLTIALEGWREGDKNDKTPPTM